MSNRPLLSIVIPSYNGAAYLPRAVSSAFAFSNVPVEVLVVDDGSTDDTPAVLQGLARDFPALKMFRKDNGGLSSARNFGIEQASGCYLVLLDSDDELIPIETLDALDGHVDIVRLGVEELTTDGRVIHHLDHSNARSGPQLLEAASRTRRFYTPSWAYIYRLDWLREHRLRFVDGLIHEDLLFTVEALLKCSAYVSLPVLGYRYFRHPGTITTLIDDARILRRVSSLLKVSKRLTAYANENPQIDIGWWVLNTMDYAAQLAELSKSRKPRWVVFLIELNFFAGYRNWGPYRTRKDVRFRVRKRFEEWLLAS